SWVRKIATWAPSGSKAATPRSGWRRSIGQIGTHVAAATAAGGATVNSGAIVIVHFLPGWGHAGRLQPTAGAGHRGGRARSPRSPRRRRTRVAAGPARARR